MLAFQLAYAQPALRTLAADISSRFFPDYSAQAGFPGHVQPIGNAQQIAQEVTPGVQMQPSSCHLHRQRGEAMANLHHPLPRNQLRLLNRRPPPPLSPHPVLPPFPWLSFLQ